MSASPPRLYNAEETSPQVRKSAGWLLRKARVKAIPHTRIGANVFWTDEQIARIIRDGAVEPKPRAEKTPRKLAAVASPPAPAPRAGRKRVPAATKTDIPRADRSVSRLYRQENAS
ncbi:hypothetical protein AB0F88_39690 [Streptosporangium sp. NPDC023963]|uniref:hypothetical protein n=1 Tax=Streptosporangium sp. NPDC023963 TaxID=3155608 RepID=UPI003417257A